MTPDHGLHSHAVDTTGLFSLLTTNHFRIPPLGNRQKMTDMSCKHSYIHYVICSRAFGVPPAHEFTSTTPNDRYSPRVLLYERLGPMYLWVTTLADRSLRQFTFTTAQIRRWSPGSMKRLSDNRLTPGFPQGSADKLKST
jgi:hypothetical protein